MHIPLPRAYAYVIPSQQKSKSHNIRSQPLIVLLVKRWITKEEGGKRTGGGKARRGGKIHTLITFTDIEEVHRVTLVLDSSDWCLVDNFCSRLNYFYFRPHFRRHARCNARDHS